MKTSSSQDYPKYQTKTCYTFNNSFSMPQIQTPRSTSRYILTTLAVILVITAFILVALNALQLDKRFRSSFKTGRGYTDGYLAARAKYQALCPAATQATTIISGRILSISSNSFIIEQDNLDTDPLVDGIDNARAIMVTPQTQIWMSTAKTPEQLAAEQNQFIEKIKTDPSTPPPSSVIQKMLSLADLAVGQYVVVNSTNDVRSLSTIEAASVALRP